MNEVIVGIDPSLSNTGVVVVRDGAVVSNHLLSTSPEQVRPVRLAQLRDELDDILDNSEPTLVAMEAEIWTSSQAQSSDQGAVQGVLQTTIWEYIQGVNRPGSQVGGPPRLCRFLSVNVSHVKKYVGAKEKDQILLQVFKRYKKEIMDHNIADAFVIAMIGTDFLHYDGENGHLWPELREPQIEVLDTLRDTGLVWEQHRTAREKKALRRQRKKKQRATDPRIA